MGTPETDPPPGQPSDTASRQLDHSLARGLAWTGLARWGTQLFSWVFAVAVARLLNPVDYGIIGMAYVYLGLVQLFGVFGLGAALIQRRDLDERQIARIGGASVLGGAGLFAVSVVAAPLIADFFGEPAVRSVILVMGPLFAVTSLQVLPSSLLIRDLAFRKLALIEAAESVTQMVVTLALAIAGARYWSLVLGGVVAKLVSTALMLRARPHRLAWPRDLSSIRDALRFGGEVLLSHITWYTYTNADFAVAGKVLGTVPLGAYTFAWNIANTPADRITGIFGRVTFPVFSAVQKNRAALGRYLVLLSEAVIILTLPASIGLALVAPDFVTVALGPKWQAATVPLQALSLHMTFRCVLALYPEALNALGDSKHTARVGLIQVLLLPAAFYLAARQWGINGVAIAWLVVQPLVTIPLLFGYTLRRIDLPVRALLSALWPAVSCTLPMVATVIGAQVALADASPPIRLAAAILTGVVTYSAMLLLHRKRAYRLFTGSQVAALLEERSVAGKR